MEVIEGFDVDAWIAARRCYLAATEYEDETADALQRASRRYLNRAFEVGDAQAAMGAVRAPHDGHPWRYAPSAKANSPRNPMMAQTIAARSITRQTASPSIQ